ncbi:MAG TPA: cell division protein SepF [Pseudobacteroides sp.]|uniref:cell division protein SepF n=1 Tax=Pseudobacteroides sp. TaxID=1968840 RepID=UPI002F931B40
MAKLINKVLNFVGWEAEEEDELVDEKEVERERDDIAQPQFFNSNKKSQQNKVVNIHTASQYKLVVMQPENFEDAQNIGDHLKNKKPIVVNLEGLEKESARRVVDFLSGAVYALDGSIQRVSANIFIIAPNNVDIMADFKEELRNKGVFPWAK